MCHSAEQKCQEQRNQQVVLSQKNIFPIKSVNGQNNHVGKIYGEKIIENVFVLKQNTVVCFMDFFFLHNTEPKTKHKLT